MMMVGVRFSAVADSTMTICVRPVTLSVSSRTFSPSTMSLNVDLAADLGEDGRGERIPLDERLAGFDVLAVVHLQRRAVDERVTLLLAAVVSRSRLRPSSTSCRVSSMISSLPLRLMTTRSPFLFVTVATLTNCTVPGVRGLVLRLLGNARCRTADVEGTHGELRARLADRLARR